MKFTLNKPPALNKLYGHNKWGGKYLKIPGRIWKEQAMWEIKIRKPQSWNVPLKMHVDLYTCRYQDNDGVLKLLMDTMQDADVYRNDYLVFDLRVVKHKVPMKEERIEVDINPITD